MVFKKVLLKLLNVLLYQLLGNSCYRKFKNYAFPNKNPFQKSQNHTFSFPSVTKFDSTNRKSQTLVCDIHATLLRSQSFFPYFMLVAFEGGSILRALLLLLSCPILWVLDHEMKMKTMIFITFCGLKVKYMENVKRAVLPKFYLENMNFKVYEIFESTGCKVVVTSVPKVMVEGFLRDYLGISDVLGTDLKIAGKYFTGFVSEAGLLVKHKAVKDYFGDKKPDIGIGASSLHDQHLLSLCEEAYVVNNEDKNGATSIMPRENYPKPLVFHDGRLAFLPTPLATFSMFIWLPPGIFLALFRLFVGIFLPYKVAIILGSLSGVQIRVKGSSPPPSGNGKGVLYVCTHRTLLDPVFLSTSLGKPLTAVTYSLSKMSEIIAPIKTVRLTRDRQMDGRMMEKLLKEGDLVVCPEGTTCREPYLLRFSSLFAELADEIVPVAMDTRVTMFYGTTASGLKCLDPIFFLMNPRPKYFVRILGKLPMEWTCAGGRSSHDVANFIQRQLADALGFECTTLTRRDKYLMLAGNEGVVEEKGKKKL